MKNNCHLHHQWAKFEKQERIDDLKWQGQVVFFFLGGTGKSENAKTPLFKQRSYM